MHAIHFRPARAEDVDQLAPLIHAAAPRLTDYSLGREQGMAFIRNSFLSNKGFYAQAHQHVGEVDGQVVLTATLYPGDLYPRLVKEAGLHTFKFFGLIGTVRILLKSLPISHFFETPPKNSVFVANLSVLPSWRGQGVAQQFFAKHVPAQCSPETASLCLDVGLDNPRAQQLYERLGFAVTQTHPYTGRADLDGVARMFKPLL